MWASICDLPGADSIEANFILDNVEGSRAVRVYQALQRTLQKYFYPGHGVMSLCLFSGVADTPTDRMFPRSELSIHPLLLTIAG